MTGVCTDCQNNTTGDNCNRCAESYYGDPLSDTGCQGNLSEKICTPAVCLINVCMKYNFVAFICNGFASSKSTPELIIEPHVEYIHYYPVLQDVTVQ